MNAKRYNPCTAIRNSLLLAGYSTVKVTNAVNSALGELKANSSESKLGDGKLSKTHYKVSETTTEKYLGELSSAPLRFDAWASQVAKAEKIASFETIALPGIFCLWMDKFAKVSKEEAAKEAVTVG